MPARGFRQWRAIVTGVRFIDFNSLRAAADLAAEIGQGATARGATPIDPN
jgi:hypothetical protein